MIRLACATRRLAACIAAAALLATALMPLLAHAVGTAPVTGWGALCTSGGARWGAVAAVLNAGPGATGTDAPDAEAGTAALNAQAGTAVPNVEAGTEVPDAQSGTAVPGADPGPRPLKLMSLEHCPWCSLHTPPADLPPAEPAPWPTAQAAPRPVPSAVEARTPSPHWKQAQPRAPPRAR